MIRDMKQGKPMKLILEFSLPLLFGFLFQQFYSLADTVIVGRILGVQALAAVGATGSVNFLIIGFCMGVCSGFGIPIAQKFGAKDEVGLRRFVANSVYLAIVFAVIMTVIVVAFCRPILELMQTPEDIIDRSYQYIVIIFIGIPVTYLYNLLAAYIRSLGDAKTPVIFLTIASLLNIILDFVCILVFNMGVAGAALATVVSQLVSALCCFFYMRKKFQILKLSREEWKADTHLMKILCGMGVPMGLQYSITAIGGVILQSAVNTLGSTIVASITAAQKIGMFFCCPFDAMGTTMATYGGQNIGARKLERINEGIKNCVVLGAVYSVLALVIIYFTGERITMLFVDGNETQILQNVRRFLLINAAFYFPLALVNIVRFMIQGLGFPRFAIIAGVCEMVARAAAGFLLVPVMGYMGACLASPLAWIAADLFLIPAYMSVMKKLRILFEDKQNTVMEMEEAHEV